jgi:hypothetical protein
MRDAEGEECWLVTLPLLTHPEQGGGQESRSRGQSQRLPGVRMEHFALKPALVCLFLNSPSFLGNYTHMQFKNGVEITFPVPSSLLTSRSSVAGHNYQGVGFQSDPEHSIPAGNPGALCSHAHCAAFRLPSQPVCTPQHGPPRKAVGHLCTCALLPPSSVPSRHCASFSCSLWKCCGCFQSSDM